MVSKQSIKSKAMDAAFLTPKTNKTPDQHESRPVAKTGPGALSAFLAQESVVLAENEQLKQSLKEWEGGLLTKLIDPSLIRPSKWINRHEDSYLTPAFASFRQEIASAGGNIQPIKVRPIPGTEPQEYEMIFGRRRRRACLDEGLEVLALVESLSDQAAFEQIDRENRERENLRPYEQGAMYDQALREKLYPSIRMLALGVGAQPGNVATALQIARLPEVVLNAFPSRLDIQYRWGTALTERIKNHGDFVLSKAVDLSKTKDLSAAEVFAQLMTDPNQERSPAKSNEKVITRGGKVFARIKRNTKGGGCVIRFEEMQESDLKQIEDFLTSLS